MSPHHTVLITFPSTSSYLCISWAISTNVVFLVQDIIELKCSEFREVSRAVLQLISESCTISTVHVRAVFGLSIWMCAAVSRTQ